MEVKDNVKQPGNPEPTAKNTTPAVDPLAAKVKELKKELSAVKKELKQTTAELDTATKKAEAYFQKWRSLVQGSVSRDQKVTSSLDMLGDAMNLAMKNLRQAFLTAQDTPAYATEYAPEEEA